MFDTSKVLAELGFQAPQPGTCFGNGRWGEVGGRSLFNAVNPADETVTAKIAGSSVEDFEELVRGAWDAHLRWRMVPAPKRGELVARIGSLIEKHWEGVAALVALDTGKSMMEARAEARVHRHGDARRGQSRMLYGFTQQSQRAKHRM
jgi:aldehyde dehydrogenase (NAD+)